MGDKNNIFSAIFGSIPTNLFAYKHFTGYSQAAIQKLIYNMYNNQVFTVEASELLDWVQSAIDSMDEALFPKTSWRLLFLHLIRFILEITEEV